MMFPKPGKSKRRPKHDGREVLTEAQWRKRRWELYVLLCDEGRGNGQICFRCGCRLEFGNVAGFASGDEMTNYHAHHSRGTRGLGGGYRDDRILVPGIFDHVWRDEKFPFMPDPPDGMVFNLYALCNNCHAEEHNQGCSGELQWSGGSNGESSSN